jgi:hypothetical protein
MKTNPGVLTLGQQRLAANFKALTRMARRLLLDGLIFLKTRQFDRRTVWSQTLIKSRHIAKFAPNQP